jgi:hypothetical protein
VRPRGREIARSPHVKAVTAGLWGGDAHHRTARSKAIALSYSRSASSRSGALLSQSAALGAISKARKQSLRSHATGKPRLVQRGFRFLARVPISPSHGRHVRAAGRSMKVARYTTSSLEDVVRNTIENQP